MTNSGKRLTESPEAPVWNKHPRPLIRRDSFLNLCGKWNFSVREDGIKLDIGTNSIKVPFPPESVLSGINRHFSEGAELVYERTVNLPEGFRLDKVLLHIDGADQHAEVYAEDKLIGSHDGGYGHFTLDISDCPDTFRLKIVVRDDLRNLSEPYGKQSMKRGGMWYTPFSGLWQPVWIESVPGIHVSAIKIKTDLEKAVISTGDLSHRGSVTIETGRGEKVFPLIGGRAVVEPDEPVLWTPEEPYLYHFTLWLDSGDEISSYFALREIKVLENEDGSRITLNGKPYFFHGLLDQGYFSDGLSTPADPKVYEDDILTAKSMGFNTLRKHLKVEPDLFYAACDSLGMIVFQDMVNNSDYNFMRDIALPNMGFVLKDDRNTHTDQKIRETFLTRMEETIEQLFSFPSIMYWTIFNEGWGQFDSQLVRLRLKKLDSSRLIDAASGWFDRGAGDVTSVHSYNKHYRHRQQKKPVILSECGGYACAINSHSFNPSNIYGYGKFRTAGELEERVERFYTEDILPAIKQGLCGCIYTQLSDIEDEVNGLLTYDRLVTKLDPEKMLAVSRQLFDEFDKR